MRKVLIVDDSPDALALAKARLGKEGLELICADGGRAGLETASREKPDLILLDVMMPKMNGFDVCRKLREDPAFADIPILLLTARGQEIDRKMGLEAGASEYITKPFSPRQLLQTVQEKLGLETAGGK